MGPVSSRSFAAALASLDEAALAALVADLWTASGWESTVDAPHVIAERGGRRRRIRVVPADGPVGRILQRSPALDDPDVVVDAAGSDSVAAAARTAGAEYVGPSDLRARLRYAVPRETGRALARRHLDRSLGADPTPLGLAPPLGTFAVTAVLLVLFGAVLTAGLYGFTAAPPGDASGTPNAAGTDGGTDPAATTSGTRTRTATGTPYPPGVSASGVDDVDALTDAHVARTEDRRYAVTVRFDGPRAAPGFDDWTAVEWSLHVESRSRFLVDATYRRVGANGTERAGLGVYSGGGALYRRVETSDGTLYASNQVRTRRTRAYRLFTSSLIGRYLDTSQSSVSFADGGDDERLHVVATGTPHRIDAPVSDYRAEATVTPGGRVTALDVRYDLDGAERPVRVGVHYDEYRSATVDRPDWLDEARNATDR